MNHIKLTVVGDGDVGKTCMLISYAKNEIRTEYVPRVFDNYCVNVTVDEKMACVGLWDTAGEKDYARLRPLSYPQTDVFFVCYSVENRSSLENIESKWLPEVRQYCPDVPLVLVACKIDLRDTSSRADILTYKDGYDVAKRWGMRFCETSALTKKGLKDCFKEAIRTVLSSPVSQN